MKASLRAPAWWQSSIDWLAPAAALIAAVFVAYSPALRGGWIWDDDYYVTHNATLRTLEGLWRIWTDIGAVPQYYPVTHTSFWIEWRIWGSDPFGYRVLNVLLHSANALLVGLILRRLALPGWWIVPWVFALHPVHVESVAWVTERKNVLSGLFYLLALLVYLRWSLPRTSSDKPQGTLYFLSLALFICALLSKSVTSSLPAVVLLIVYWKRGRIARRDVLPLLPFFALGAAMGALTSWMERNVVGAQGPEFALSLPDRVLIAGRAVWFYVTKLLWPNPLIFMYPRWRIDPAAVWQFTFPVAALGLVASLWALRHRIGRGPLVAALFFGGTLFPALGFVNVLPMRYSFVADHFQYLASLGVLTLLAVVVATRASRRAATTFTAVACLALAVVTWNHAHDFRDIETLWRSTLAKNPSSWMAHNNLGILLYERQDYGGAAARFRQAIALKPDHDQARLNLGLIAVRRGRFDEAKEWYLDALRVKPGFANAYYNLGRLATIRGNALEASEYYQRAISANPRHDAAMVDLGIALVARGNVDGAERRFRQALDVRPDNVDALLNLATVLAYRGDPVAAQRYLSEALRVDPRNAKVRAQLQSLRDTR